MLSNIIRPLILNFQNELTEDTLCIVIKLVLAINEVVLGSKYFDLIAAKSVHVWCGVWLIVDFV